MLIWTRSLWILFLYSISQIYCTEILGSDDVLTKVLDEIRSKIIDSENSTQPISSEFILESDKDFHSHEIVQKSTKKDGEVKVEKDGEIKVEKDDEVKVEKETKLDDRMEKEAKQMLDEMINGLKEENTGATPEPSDQESFEATTLLIPEPTTTISSSKKPKINKLDGKNKKMLETSVKEKSAEESKEVQDPPTLPTQPVKTTLPPKAHASSENFVANFVVQPEFHHQIEQQHKPKLEFAPHFEHNIFEFMVPEDKNEAESLVAIIQFYGHADSKNLPKFKILNDTQKWFSIGKVNHTEGETYSIELVQILLNPNVTVSRKFAGLNGIYSIAIEATQDNYKDLTKLQVEILSLLDEDNNQNADSSDLILSRLESPVTQQKVELNFNQPVNDSLDKIKNIGQDETDKVILDWSNNNETQLEAENRVEEENVVFPEINMELRGALDSTVSVSESLHNGALISDFNVFLSTGVPFDEIAELSIEPNDVFAFKPKFLLPNEQSQMMVIDSKKLDFDADPKPMEFEIRAKFINAPENQTVTVKKLIVEKRNEADHAPRFEQSTYIFRVSELAENSTIIGHIMALDEDLMNGHFDESAIQYTLLGQGSQNFYIANGSLILNCVQDFSDCLDYEQINEYNLLAIAIDQYGLSSDPVLVTVKVEDANENGPVFEMFEDEILIEDSEIRSPFLFEIHDQDTLKNQDNLVGMSNDASKFLSLERLSQNTYRIQVSRSPAVGLYNLDLAVRDAKGENLSQKTRVKVNVLTSTPKIMFHRQHYERLINDAQKLQTGSPIIQLELDGAEKDTIRFMLLEGNPGYLAIEEYGGNVYVGQLPSQGIKSGKFNVKVAAVDRDSQRILATTDFQLTIQGGQKEAVSKVFANPLMTVFVERESQKTDLVIPITTTTSNDIDFKLVEIEAWDDELLALDIDQTSVQLKENQVIISSQLIQKANSISVKLGLDQEEAGKETALLQIFSTRDPQKIKEAEEALAVPKFSTPWTNEESVIPLRVQEELPIGHTILCMPALNQLDTSIVEEVELSGEGNDYFKLNEKNGCLLIQKRIDFEALQNKSFDLVLTAKLGVHQTKAQIHIHFVDLDDNAPQLQLLNSKQMPLEVMENEKAETKLADFLILDEDHVGKNQQFKFKLTGLGAENFNVKLHEKNPSILVLTLGFNPRLDREKDGKIALKLTVTDQAGNSNDLPIHIKLLDENDNSPEFIKKSTEVDIFDNWPVDIELASFNAIDIDSGNNSKLTYSLDQNAGKYFSINPKSGIVKIANSLTGLARPELYTIGVLAIDQGNPPRSAMTGFKVHIHESTAIQDIDSQEIRIITPPIDFQLNLTENLPSGSLIYKVEAVLGMLGESVEADVLSYSLEPIDSSDDGWLTIDETLGDVHLLRSLDYEKQRYITVGLNFDKI